MRWLETRNKIRKMVVHTRETDRADESDVDDVLVTETCGPEVNFVLGWDRQDFSDCGWREEGHLRGCEKGTTNDQRTHDKVLEESVSPFKVDV